MLVGVFVLCMCGMLLLLYFFFSYLGKLLRTLLSNINNILTCCFYYVLQCSLRHHWPVRFGVNHSCLSVPWANCSSYPGRGCQVRTVILIRETYSFLEYIFIVNVSFFLDCLVATLVLCKSTLKCGNSFYLLEPWHWPSAGWYTAKRNSLGFFRIFWVLLSGMKKRPSPYTHLLAITAFCFSFQRQHDSSGAVAQLENLHTPSSLALLLRHFLRLHYATFHQGNGTLLIYFSYPFKGSYILIRSVQSHSA